MSVSISDIPYDIVHHIASHLRLRDFVNFSFVNRKVYRHLQDERTAKRALQASFANGRKEAGPVLDSTSFPRWTISKIFDQSEAQKTAAPYSVSTLAYASSFCFYQGCLCYATHTEVRILGLQATSKVERVLHRKFFGISYEGPGDRSCSVWLYPRTMTVLGFAHSIIVVLCNFGSDKGQYLFAVAIAKTPEILITERLRSTNRLFVRHNAEFLYYGTHSAIGSNGHHEWLLQGFNLSTCESLTEQPFQLYDFSGCEIGSTICFTIFDDEFYGLTTQTTFDGEEVDWTSYYNYIRFPLNLNETELFPITYSSGYRSSPHLKIKTIFRRQHLEGPIHDAWNDLTFQVDESTGELLVVECRREWLNGNTKSERTCYIEPFERAIHGEVSTQALVTSEVQLVKPVDSLQPYDRCEKPKMRIEKYVHRDFSAANGHDGNVKPVDYLRTKTKWNAYDFNTNSFVDLVTEDCRSGIEWRTNECIKLRVVSRLRESPLLENKSGGTWMFRSKLRDASGNEIQDSDEAFTDSYIHVWPNDDAPDDMNELLCPGGRAGEVKAMMCSFGIVYTAGPPNAKGERALIYISFDPSWGFEGMKRLDGSLAKPRHRDTFQVTSHESTSVTTNMKGKKRDRSSVEPELGNSTGSETTSKKYKTTQSPSSSTEILSGFERAMYLDIARGYWLR